VSQYSTFNKLGQQFNRREYPLTILYLVAVVLFLPSSDFLVLICCFLALVAIIRKSLLLDTSLDVYLTHCSFISDNNKNIIKVFCRLVSNTHIIKILPRILLTRISLNIYLELPLIIKLYILCSIIGIIILYVMKDREKIEKTMRLVVNNKKEFFSIYLLYSLWFFGVVYFFMVISTLILENELFVCMPVSQNSLIYFLFKSP